MMEYMNANHGDQYIFKYSTPSKYVDAIKSYNATWPVKYDDMFPYSSAPDSYWTGYFTTRPNQKQYIRRASREYKASNQLYAMQVIDEKASDEKIANILNAKYSLVENLSVLQHHDAVTGTPKQFVADDYVNKLWNGMQANTETYEEAMADAIKRDTGVVSKEAWQQCFRTNSTYLDCPIGQKSISQGF